MPPARTISDRLSADEARCQSEAAALVCALDDRDKSMHTSGDTPPAATISSTAFESFARSDSAATARSCGVSSSTLNPSPRRRTSGGMAPACAMAARSTAERAVSTARAEAAFICAEALRVASTSTRRRTTECDAFEPTSDARWSRAHTAWFCVSGVSDASSATSGPIARAFARAVWFSSESRASASTAAHACCCVAIAPCSRRATSGAMAPALATAIWCWCVFAAHQSARVAFSCGSVRSLTSNATRLGMPPTAANKSAAREYSLCAACPPDVGERRPPAASAGCHLLTSSSRAFSLAFSFSSSSPYSAASVTERSLNAFNAACASFKFAFASATRRAGSSEAHSREVSALTTGSTAASAARGGISAES